MDKKLSNIKNRKTIAYIPENKIQNIIYTFLSEEESDQVYNLMETDDTVLVTVVETDWNHDFSPWAAKRVFKKEKDFGGGANDFLKELCEDIMPEVEKSIGASQFKRGLVGYSLAGLFATYSIYNCDKFNFFGSISGSLWFDGFLDYIKEREINTKLEKAYFSLGQKEKETRNPRMAVVEDVTIEIANIFQEEGIGSLFELNDGNHFTEKEIRIAKGMKYLT